jgi:hypothetical protein
MKKESRVARIEALPRGGSLIIVFRGGWVDGLSAIAGGADKEGAADRLEGSKYLEELRGISLGEGLEVAEAARLRSWARSKGLPEVEMGARNRRQARVLAEGFSQLLEGKG